MDDHSSDGSVQEIRNWATRTGSECRILAHSENRGICATLNEAVDHARGKYISLIATDDLWLPEKLERQVAEMERLSERVAVLYSDAYRIDESGRELPRRFIDWHGHKAAPHGRVFETLLRGNFVPAMTMLIRRSALQRAGRFDERLCYEDLDMWLRISRDFEFAFSNYVSAKYRVVENSLTRRVLWTDSVPRYESEFMIFSKWLTAPGLDIASRRVAVDRMRESAQMLRRIGRPGARALARELIRQKAGPVTLWLFALSASAKPRNVIVNTGRRATRLTARVIHKLASFGN